MTTNPRFAFGSLILGASVCALTASTSAANATGTFDLKDFGAYCDGAHDDTRAIQNWLNKLGQNVRLTAPAGVCLFSEPLRAPHARAYDVIGAGPYATVFRYIGASTTADLLTINDTGHGGEGGVSIRDFRIASDTKMTGGYAFHAHGLFASVVSNVVLDGIDAGSNGNLCGGYWFDGAGGVDLDNPNAFSGQFCGDGVLVNAALGGSAELRVSGGNIGGGFRNGLHMAGGFGGFRCDQTNVHQNGVNLLIDNAVAMAPNREFGLGSTCALDSARADNALVDDALANGGTVDFAGWVASSQTANGIHVRRWRNGDVEVRGNKIYNNCLDGIFIEDASAHVLIGSFAAISNNGNAKISPDCVIPPRRGQSVSLPAGDPNVVNAARPWNNSGDHPAKPE